MTKLWFLLTILAPWAPFYLFYTQAGLEHPVPVGIAVVILAESLIIYCFRRLLISIQGGWDLE